MNYIFWEVGLSNTPDGTTNSIFRGRHFQIGRTKHLVCCSMSSVDGTGDVTHLQLGCPPAPRGRHHHRSLNN